MASTHAEETEAVEAWTREAAAVLKIKAEEKAFTAS